MNPRLSIHAAILSLVLVCVNHTVWAQPGLSLEELLARHEASQQVWNRIQMTVSHETLTVDSAHATSVLYVLQGEIRRNGELFDRILTSDYPALERPSRKTRYVWDARRWYMHYMGATAEESSLSFSDDAEKARRHVDNYFILSPLWGGFRGNVIPIVELLRDSEDAAVEQEMEDVNGRSCYVVAASTTAGRHRIWIDPERGYHIVKAEVKKRGGDAYYRETLPTPPYVVPKSILETWPKDIPPPATSPVIEYEFTMDSVSFQKIGDTWVPVEAKWETRTLRENGRTSIASITFNASDVDLDPDFQALGAFKLDVIDGTKVYGPPPDNRGSLAWKDGEIVRGARPRNLLPEIYDEQANRRELIAKALEEANQEEKRVIIVWGSNACAWCHMLDRQCRADAKIQELLENHYVLVHIDLTHRDEHTDLALDYDLDLNVLRTPHITILGEDDKPIVQKQSSSLVTFKNGSSVYSEKRIARMLEEYRRESK